uniref:CLIP domain-containing serine protease n=1 Tax=Anopheles christyi TaxID=43041 RepID=A0A3F2YTZ2_9DIPT
MEQRHATRSRWLFLSIILIALTANANESEAFCTNPSGDRGMCIYFLNCKPLPQALITDLAFLKNSQCNQNEGPGFVSTTYKQQCMKVIKSVTNILKIWQICCPDKRHFLPKPPFCGVRTTSRLIGIQLTQPYDYSWTALIEYEKQDASTGIYCGGTLINQGHILTAAHCVSSLPIGWKVNRVLLGEWDLSSVLDCAENFCNNPPIDLKISKIIVHDGYDTENGSSIHDIALIRFEKLANFPDAFQPICLSQAESTKREIVTDGISTIVGWGKNQNSAGVVKKLKTDLMVTKDFPKCYSSMKHEEQIEPSYLCALRERSSRMICSADSGGGLTRLFHRYHYLIGVAGSGEHSCGTVEVPGVFINVAGYIDWIRENIK